MPTFQASRNSVNNVAERSIPNLFERLENSVPVSARRNTRTEVAYDDFTTEVANITDPSKHNQMGGRLQSISPMRRNLV